MLDMAILCRSKPAEYWQFHLIQSNKTKKITKIHSRTEEILGEVHTQLERKIKKQTIGEGLEKQSNVKGRGGSRVDLVPEVGKLGRWAAAWSL